MDVEILSCLISVLIVCFVCGLILVYIVLSVIIKYLNKNLSDE